MAGDDLAFRTATELAAAVAAKEVSSRELLDLYLSRVDQLDDSVHAVVTLDADRARAAATAADEATARGESTGPLHGLPITIKDAIETEGIRSTGGAIELTDHVPTADAPAVARLKAAGAIVFGKTNLPRWSGDLQSYNEIFGTTNNPWDTSRVPGGSSGGGRRGGLRTHELRARHRHRWIGAHPVALLRRVRIEDELRRRSSTRLPRSSGRWHHRS